jgi:hypothetical protein
MARRSTLGVLTVIPDGSAAGTGRWNGLKSCAASGTEILAQDLADKLRRDLSRTPYSIPESINPGYGAFSPIGTADRPWIVHARSCLLRLYHRHGDKPVDHHR